MSRQRVKNMQQHGALSIKSIMLHHIHRKPFTVNVLKCGTLSLFSSQLNKMLVRIANRKDPNQTASSEAV